jgi:hypothetical protein
MSILSLCLVYCLIFSMFFVALFSEDIFLFLKARFGLMKKFLFGSLFAVMFGVLAFFGGALSMKHCGFLQKMLGAPDCCKPCKPDCKPDKKCCACECGCESKEGRKDNQNDFGRDCICECEKCPCPCGCDVGELCGCKTKR